MGKVDSRVANGNVATSVPSEAERIILFDGHCNLCHGTVLFVIRRDSNKRFRFASLQSKAAQQLLQGYALPIGLDSFIYYEEGKLYTESTAALHVAKQLDGWWKLMYGWIIIPRWIRNSVYRYVARNRYRWFGRKEECMIPTPELRARFLEE